MSNWFDDIQLDDAFAGQRVDENGQFHYPELQTTHYSVSASAEAWTVGGCSVARTRLILMARNRHDVTVGQANI